MENNNQKAEFRDVDLQLATSARLLTYEDLQKYMYEGKDFCLHRLILEKKFSTLLKVFQSGTVTMELLD